MTVASNIILNDIQGRVIIDKIEYRPKVFLDTYIPQIKVGDKWIDIMKVGFILKNSFIGNQPDIKSVDQLDLALNMIKIKINQIVECQKLISELNEFSKLINI
jgi:hypothetical protein